MGHLDTMIVSMTQAQVVVPNKIIYRTRNGYAYLFRLNLVDKIYSISKYTESPFINKCLDMFAFSFTITSIPNSKKISPLSGDPLWILQYVLTILKTDCSAKTSQIRPVQVIFIP